ncbi:hypothetical protein STAFG_2788 [Streptomyces afghaniensis 772]|uniref:Uncharacterized protein n=1 Tax=Streptomyces afghaniensis 772 TaxID=1283301 RepID=S4MKT0_9ACTN|nr:hypothetical protein STAFG_2788 [Streptomyces afghaniensis 772]
MRPVGRRDRDRGSTVPATIGHGQFDRRTREFVERTLDGVIPAMGYAA